MYLKHLRCILFIIFSFLFHQSFSQTKAAIGMSIAELKEIYPIVDSSCYKKEITFTRKEEIHGITGRWAFQFEDGKLNWILFDKYINDLNKRNFNTCLHATKEIIKDFTKAYGRPDTTIVGKTKFIDPYKQHHWGYDVLEARWKNYNGMKIKVEFTFFGGKGDYFFVMSINYFDKDYPSYD